MMRKLVGIMMIIISIAARGAGAADEKERMNALIGSAPPKIKVPVLNPLVTMAIHEGSLDKVKKFLHASNKAHVDVPDLDGRTALWHAAASRNAIPLVTYLMTECDACCFKPDFNGYSPYDVALMDGNKELVAMFQKLTTDYMERRKQFLERRRADSARAASPEGPA